MSAANFRFRNEGALVVLQVYEPPKIGAYAYEKDGIWRDAKTEDLLDVAKLVAPRIVQEHLNYSGSGPLPFQGRFDDPT